MADNNIITVTVVTPYGIQYSHRAHMVSVKSIDGDLGIMANHEPIVAPLKISEVRVKRTDDTTHVDAIAVNGGFIEFQDNVATIVADGAERARDIDLSKAEQERSEAEQKLHEAETQHDIDQQRRAEVALKKAMNRINVSKHL